MSHSRDREGRALQRILSTPHLAQAVPRLPAELLHRVIRQHGLEDCAELVALATPEQIARVLDLDLWRPARAGLDEQFDAGRFGVWLHVLLEGGEAHAAQRLAALAPDLVVTGLARHVRVFDAGVVMSYITLDGEVAGGRDDGGTLTRDIGGYRLVARRDDAWDAIVDVLFELERAHAASFHAVMTRCRALSNSRPEESGMHDLLEDPEQAMFDLAIDRERRREQHGYVTPAQARAFLKMARRPAAHAGAADPIAAAYFRALDEHLRESQQQRLSLPHAAACNADDDEADGMAAIVEALLDSGMLDAPQRALPSTSHEQAPRLSRIHLAMRVVGDRDPDLYARRSGELGYLANTLLSGCSMQARAFTPQESSDAAVAVSNLGLDTWPGPLADDVLVTHDLVAVFQRGWSVLYERVSLQAARGVLDALTRTRVHDRETQIALNRLRVELTRHLEAGAPWRARAALEAIASLDLLAWTALSGLFDECPVQHAAIGVLRAKGHAVSPAAFEFISESAQIDAIHHFLATLDQLF